MNKVLVLAESSLDKCWQYYLKNPEFDVYELRLDLLIDWQLTEVKSFIHKMPKPVILTLRSIQEGGGFAGNYSKSIRELAGLGAKYIDVEQRFGQDLMHELKREYPNLIIIGSRHLDYTPDDFSDLISNVCDINKLITKANSTLDALRLMHYATNNPGIVIHAMGEYGLVSRIYAIIKCQPLIFIGGEPSASKHEMLETYKISRLRPWTKLLGLLGMPISHSKGRSYHNCRLGSEAVYVNLPLSKAELSEFFELVHGLPFIGFSITTPLKQEICNYVRTDLTAINTIVRFKDTWLGYNTDGIGAITALGPIHGRVLLIGAGGSAIAIADQMSQDKIPFVVLNRSISKAKKITAEYYDYESFNSVSHETFGAVINATPNTPENIRLLTEILANNVNQNTKYLSLDYHNQIQLKLNIIKVSPQKMFECQAHKQLQIFNKYVSISLFRNKLCIEN